LEAIDKFLDAFNLTKLNQEDVNHLNRLIISKEIEGAQDLMNSLPNSLRHLWKN
jgi:hypothetical protein